MSVMKALWEFRGGHYVHNDVHGGQILPIGSGNDTLELRCHVIDFGTVQSLDQTKAAKMGRLGYLKSTIWYAALHNETQRIAYVREHGAAEFRRRGWESGVLQWARTVFLQAYGVNPFPGGADWEEDGAIAAAKWCRAAEMMTTLVDELEQGADNGGRPAVKAAALRMVVEQATIIKSGVAAAMNCSVPEVVPKSPGRRG